jgi:hypothetical protein
MNDLTQAVAKTLSSPKMLCIDAAYESPNGSRRLQSYSFFIQPGDSPEVGDVVITTIKPILSLPYSDEKPGLGSVKIAYVTGVYSTINPMATKSYLALIPAKILQTRFAAQSEIALRFKQKQDALAALQAAFNEAQMLKMFEVLAENDPAMGELLKIARWTPGAED